MKWNASPAAALFLSLAACGGGGGYREYAPETAPAAPGSVAAQSWQAEPAASETWRAADGSIRTRTRAPAPEEPAPPLEDAAPGASYAPPAQDDARGAAYAPPPAEPARYRAPAPAYTPPQDGYADPAAGATGPRGSSQPGPGEARYDEIGYAGLRPVAGGAAAEGAVVAVHPTLPAGSVVEVTSLDTGRTILVLITGAMPPGTSNAIDLSAGAARQLGADGLPRLAVRVRKVAATPQDMLALRAGRPAADRADTPPVLLTALRKRLPEPVAARPAYAPASPTYSRPAPSVAAPRPAPRAPVSGGYIVQVAALSNARNAQALAQSMNGFVKAGGGLYRVQLGPFATAGQAESARIGAARAGYGDARVLAVTK